MIRERRDEDLDRLVAVLETLGHSATTLAATDLRKWLTEHDAERSWVFDQAPVPVAPTRNVVGHVQIYGFVDEVSTPVFTEFPDRAAGDLLAIGKLFVKRSTYDHGIARYLLTESVKHIRGQGKTPVLELRENPFLTREFCQRYKFAATPAPEPGLEPMIHTG